ncbi:MAG: hypothetical protein NC120_14135 [Ruminococcus sp.]|nr:hypothetical protein [Ruminococcus sp.]
MNSAAKIKANNKYAKANYQKIQAMIKPADYTIIDNFCRCNNISKAQLIVEACRRYIDDYNKNEGDGMDGKG